MKRCPICLVEIPPLSAQGRPATYCSGRCRVRGFRLQKRVRNLPLAMVNAERWTRHVSKRPVQPDGTPASSTKPETWSSYVAAAASPIGHGVGFMLGDYFACIDLDHSLDDNGEPLDWVKPLLDQLPDTYIERSLSGTGLHVFGWHRPRGGFNRRIGDNRVEFYSRDRFIAVTGDIVGECHDLADLSGVEFLNR